MPSDGYWRERNLKDKALSVNAAEDYIREHAGRMYAQAREEIQGEIEAFYQKYADENGLTLQEARKKISQAEFKDIDWEAYCMRSAELERELRSKRDSLPREIVERMEQEWQEHEEKIKTLAARGNITRLELLQADIDRNVLNLHDASQMSLYTYLSGQYEDGYYRGIYGVQHHTGIGFGFTTINTAAVEKALLSQADRRNFSQTIYKNVKNLEREIKDCLTTGMIKGEDMGKLTRRVQGRLNVSYSNARRLVRTETAYAYEQASLAAYAECDVIEYEYMAELDHRTSDLCRDLDGRHFKIADAVPGTNYPPMHPNCRSTTAASAFDDTVPHGAAGDYEDGGYPVPPDMTYEEWKDTYGYGGQTEQYGVYGTYTETEIKQLARETQRLADKHFTARESRWSGNIIFKDDADAPAGKEWNCDISTSHSTAKHILLHEQLHAKSVSHYDEDTFLKYRPFEEGPTELLAKEICIRENIPIEESSYDDIVEALRRINHRAHICDSDYEFAIKLYGVELPERRKWLENTIDENMKSSTLEERVSVYELMDKHFGGQEDGQV
ncbi:MAG: minor capsid protein [Lachnospiraceae bacterium]|nr:minor capsid protein [Lachnospiraceae bacterium]